MTATPAEADLYYPPPESAGGWRYLTDPEQVGALAGMDAQRLALVQRAQEFLHGGDSWGIVIIRRGYLVGEWYTFNVLIPTRFDVWSCTKSFTGSAWGLLLDDSRQHRLPQGQEIDLDSLAYAYIPQGLPLSDSRKGQITLRHLLTMTSGIPGEGQGLMGLPTATGNGPFEHALGRSPNRYGYWADRLVAEPGTHWEYSDPAFAHLSLLFAHVSGQELSTYLAQRVFERIGIEEMCWDSQGGSGCIGPHTNAHTGLHLSARDLARFGYLALRQGLWRGEEILPRWWMELATRTSQDLNPAYGYTWWVNTPRTRWPELPADAFALSGYRSNRCYIIPSLDLVVARVGSGPPQWDEQTLIRGIVGAVISEQDASSGAATA
jgi:CubicO group peptidase (beta-lactamase class C family)